jgi:hypothetical protein
MSVFDLSLLSREQRPTGLWTLALLHAIAREEVRGRRPPRLLAPVPFMWSPFRSRLEPADFVSLLFEDAAVTNPIPFDPYAVGPELALPCLPDTVLEAWVLRMGSIPHGAPGADYLSEQASRLGLPTGLARLELAPAPPSRTILELPGSGGQLAYALVQRDRTLVLEDAIVVACSGWKELTLAGLVALELGAARTDFIVPVASEPPHPPSHPRIARGFARVLGLSAESGGPPWDDHALARSFPGAEVVLV